MDIKDEAAAKPTWANDEIVCMEIEAGTLNPSNLRKTIEWHGTKECDYRLFRPKFDEYGQRYPR
ncbi:hypothetical protein [Metapseudomonas boanensis]|uniref:Uncharacterized protein n=1 Tax=Metapseudomonas boanensis TaxID=2822138 RepID=A0ABS5XGG3_9GAMM|nr:hypothetical protein [Pseudomonas boanensis]MBT8766759.1 hypothetical protein [Pseudomonas boanensis]